MQCEYNVFTQMTIFVKFLALKNPGFSGFLTVFGLFLAFAAAITVTAQVGDHGDQGQEHRDKRCCRR